MLHLVKSPVDNLIRNIGLTLMEQLSQHWMSSFQSLYSASFKAAQLDKGFT